MLNSNRFDNKIYISCHDAICNGCCMEKGKILPFSIRDTISKAYFDLVIRMYGNLLLFFLGIATNIALHSLMILVLTLGFTF